MRKNAGLPRSAQAVGAVARVGTLAPAGGRVRVRVDGGAPMPVRLVEGLDRARLSRPDHEGREVLLLFEEGSPDRPVVLALMEAPDSPETARVLEPVPRDALVDGERVVIEADREILLRCGKGQIHIRADGTVVVRGTRLLSRSSGVNKIKGGAVQIN